MYIFGIFCTQIYQKCTFAELRLNRKKNVPIRRHIFQNWGQYVKFIHILYRNRKKLNCFIIVDFTFKNILKFTYPEFALNRKINEGNFEKNIFPKNPKIFSELKLNEKICFSFLENSKFWTNPEQNYLNRYWNWNKTELKKILSFLQTCTYGPFALNCIHFLSGKVLNFFQRTFEY